MAVLFRAKGREQLSDYLQFIYYVDFHATLRPHPRLLLCLLSLNPETLGFIFPKESASGHVWVLRQLPGCPGSSENRPQRFKCSKIREQISSLVSTLFHSFQMLSLSEIHSMAANWSHFLAASLSKDVGFNFLYSSRSVTTSAFLFPKTD